jgi:hypothetical protein
VGDFSTRLVLVATSPLVLLTLVGFVGILLVARNRRQALSGEIGVELASGVLLLKVSRDDGTLPNVVQDLPRQRSGLRAIVREGTLLALPTTLFCCFLLVPGVSHRIFASFSCDSFGFDDRDAIFHFYLHTDYSIRCSDPSYRSPAHESIKALSYFLVVVWPLGVPALFCGLLSASRSAIQYGQPTELSNAVQFITREYKPLSHYWELVDLLRKLFLTGFVLLIPQHLSFIRMILAVSVSICYLVLLTTAQPFRQRSTAFVAVATQLSLVLTLFSALLVKSIKAVHEADGDSGTSTSRILGFESAFPLTVAILVANFGVLFLVLGIIVQQASRYPFP